MLKAAGWSQYISIFKTITISSHPVTPDGAQGYRLQQLRQISVKLKMHYEVDVSILLYSAGLRAVYGNKGLFDIMTLSCTNAFRIIALVSLDLIMGFSDLSHEKHAQQSWRIVNWTAAVIKYPREHL